MLFPNLVTFLIALVTLLIALLIPPNIPDITPCAALNGAVRILCIPLNTELMVLLIAFTPVDTADLIPLHTDDIVFLHALVIDEIILEIALNID
jgi:hypothetical protein